MTSEASGGNEAMREAVNHFHTIRRFRYLSDGERDPSVIAGRQAGSCTGKHLLLRDRLRAAGYDADVETVEGDFAAGIPPHPTMAPELRAIIAEAGIDDFHNIVRLNLGDGTTLRLDATWHDGLRAYGFPVNDGWAGAGDTRIALEPRRSLGIHEDVIAFKKQCLEGFAPEKRERRVRFLKLLSSWIAQVDSSAVNVVRNIA